MAVSTAETPLLTATETLSWNVERTHSCNVERTPAIVVRTVVTAQVPGEDEGNHRRQLDVPRKLRGGPCIYSKS